MRAHNGHWRGLYLHDAVADRPLPALVLSGARLWPAAPVLDAQPAGAVPGRLPTADLVGPVQPDPAASPAGAGADQLPGSVARAVRLLEGAPAPLPDHRIIDEIISRPWTLDTTDFGLGSVRVCLFGTLNLQSASSSRAM